MSIIIINSFGNFGNVGTPTYTNLFSNPTEFDNAVWVKTASSVSANAQTAHDGTVTGDTITADGTSANHGVHQVVTWTGNSQYKTWFIAKAGTHGFIQVLWSVAAYASTSYANFNLSTGVLGTVGSSAAATIEDLGNGWYKCSVTATTIASPTGTSGTFCRLVTSATAARGEANTVSGSIHLAEAGLNKLT